jgi:hypothetical protein
MHFWRGIVLAFCSVPPRVLGIMSVIFSFGNAFSSPRTFTAYWNDTALGLSLLGDLAE